MKLKTIVENSEHLAQELKNKRAIGLYVDHRLGIYNDKVLTPDEAYERVLRTYGYEAANYARQQCKESPRRKP